MVVAGERAGLAISGGKKEDKTDQIREAPGADLDEPGGGCQEYVPASSEEAQNKLNGPLQVLKAGRHETIAVTCISNQNKPQIVSRGFLPTQRQKP